MSVCARCPTRPSSWLLFLLQCLGEPYEKVWGPRYAVALAEMAQLLQEEAPAPLRGPPMSFEAYILKHNLHSAVSEGRTTPHPSDPSRYLIPSRSDPTLLYMLLSPG